MADITVTQTGVAELRTAIAALPGAVAARLRQTAIDIGESIQADARANLLAATANDKTPETQATKTAEAIGVTVDDANKTVFVTSRGVAADPANNPIWLEHGTIHEAPKPYMLPATKAHEAEYIAAQERAAVDVAQELLG